MYPYYLYIFATAQDTTLPLANKWVDFPRVKRSERAAGYAASL
jgi:hypothetical protein